MSTANIEPGPGELEAAGIPPKHADAIAHKISQEITRAIPEITRAVGRQRGPSAITVLATATALGFVLLTSVSAYYLADASQERTAIRTELRTAIEANRDRIDAVNERISANSERLARIETLLEERLPARQ